MMYFWSTILSAIILGPVVALLQKARKENRDDHAVVAEMLQEVGKTIDKVDQKIDRHVQWHLDKE
jgi:uncharacterized FlaG/YvyC family protein